MQKSKTLVIAIPLLFILMGLVLYQYGFKRIRTDIAAIREEKDLKLELLDKYSTLISERPLLEKKLLLLREERQAEGVKLVGGSTSAITSAALQKEVKDIILGNGGKIKSERVGKTEDFGPFKVVTVSIDAEIPDSGVLGDILYSIETRTPYLVVKELDTRVRNTRFTRKRKGPGTLTVKFGVSALSAGK